MSSVYCFWKGGTPPSPWQLKSDFNGRYPKCGGNYSTHGVTGGTTQHTHTYSNVSVSNSTPTTTVGGGSDVLYIALHTHTLSLNVSSQNNDPSYYSYELIYMDLDAWENNERRFPQGAVILSDSAISWSLLTRESAADNRLIKLDTACNTGGRDNHEHSCTGTLQTTNPSISGFAHPYAQYWHPRNASHSHTITTTTPSKSIKPARVRTRVYSLNALSDKAVAGVICFVDGPTSSNWIPLNWDGYYIEGANEDANFVGVNSHDHLNLSATSSDYTVSTGYYGNEGTTSCASTHRHTVSFNLDNSNHEPQYVKLYPVKLNTTLWHINVQDKTYDIRMIVKKSTNAEYTSSIRMRGDKSVIYTPDILIRTTKSLDYSTGLLLKDINEIAFDVDANLMGRFWAQYKMGISLTYNAASYGMSLRLVRPYGPNDTIINTLYHSWIEQLNKISMKIDNSVLANRIEYATELELDTRWGKVLDLPRMINEQDYHYRKRLQVATKILTGCGTKSSCEEILSFLVDESDSARIEQDEPGKVRIYWDTDSACRRGKELSSLVSLLIPRMLAAGIEYTIYHPFKDYGMGMYLLGSGFSHYNTNLLLRKLNLDCNWTMRTRVVLKQLLDYQMDILILNSINKNYYAILTLLRGSDRNCQMDLLVKKIQRMDYEIDAIFRKLQSLNYNIDIVMQKRNISRAYSVNLLTKKSRELLYSVRSSLMLRDNSNYGMDIVLRKYDSDRYRIELNQDKNGAYIGVI